jgi:hypothetical protein
VRNAVSNTKLLICLVHKSLTGDNKSLSRFEYRWADGVQIKKPIEVSAPKYVEYLMDWIEAQLDDESIFPQKIGTATY